MGVRHKEYVVEGVQFHPESILTKSGKDLIKKLFKIMIIEAIRRLTKKENISEELLKESFIEIIEGKASQAQIAGFLIGLSMKGETEEEILTAVKLFRD